MQWNKEAMDGEEEGWVDHTCATEFELLTAKLERVLETDFSPSTEEELAVRFSFQDVEYVLTRQANSHSMGNDFSLQVDSRVNRFSVWFGLRDSHVFVLECLGGVLLDRSEAGKRLSGLSLAMSSCGIALPSVFVCDEWCLGTRAVGGGRVESLTARLPHCKLEDVQRMFRQYSRQTPRISARLSWRIPFPPNNNNNSNSNHVDIGLLSGLVCSAVFPLASERGGVFENELFSTLVPERALEWQVSCIWNSKLEGGTGYYEGADYLLLTPLACGLERLQRLANRLNSSDVSHSSINEDDLARSVAEEAFTTQESPFTQLAINLCHWLAACKGKNSQDDQDANRITNAWQHFCHILRSKFESKESVTVSHSTWLEPDLSKDEVHQKVTLVRYCQHQANATINTPSTPTKPLGFTLGATGKQAWEPSVQPFSVWSSREDVGSEGLHSQLANDMQAFKFANLGSEFVDFLKWYSPKDIDDLGQVSDRMQDGVWRQCWEQSQAVPSHLQRVVFDFVIQGEKALHWLECVNVNELVVGLIQEASLAVSKGGEALARRGEAIQSCLELPESLKRLLVENDGSAAVGAMQGQFLLEMVLNTKLEADKREYVLCDAGGHRLYVAASGTGEQESLPPTIQAVQTVAGMILTWVTAEFLVGSLDQLERDVTSKLK
ncbi:hypothetical protein BASA81_014021 [Batrachochytrium salamandrivorans]|nr:hypothetical protein BASA81_014021 [Batrachochytrium salamandrivorans]